MLHFDKVDTLTDSIVERLSPPDSEAMMETFLKRMDLFNSQEKAAIRTFFEAYKQLHPNDNWSVIESEKQKLERAHVFWMKYRR